MTIREVWPRPAEPLDVNALVERYPRSATPTLRVNFVTSIDGAVTLDGFSEGLSGPGDKLIFNALRMVCDALVVAAGTVRRENYDALRLDEARRAWRRAHGLPEFPLMVIVSRSLDLNLDQEVFSDAPIRPVVITHASASPGRCRELDKVADVIAVGDGPVDLAAGVAALHERGATQLLCEGGPHLLGALTSADLVDEMCLTISPLLIGGDAGRITTGAPGPAREMALRHVLTEGDTLFLRYQR
ncbi:MAG TPA: pyrimidine reductase family protein [Actinoplanes sp.]|nr:pyrimidine reductase family protein [Actinoplanes sp.]